MKGPCESVKEEVNEEAWGGRKGEDGKMEGEEGRDHPTHAQASEV